MRDITTSRRSLAISTTLQYGDLVQLPFAGEVYHGIVVKPGSDAIVRLSNGLTIAKKAEEIIPIPITHKSGAPANFADSLQWPFPAATRPLGHAIQDALDNLKAAYLGLTAQPTTPAERLVVDQILRTARMLKMVQDGMTAADLGSVAVEVRPERFAMA